MRCHSQSANADQIIAVKQKILQLRDKIVSAKFFARSFWLGYEPTGLHFAAGREWMAQLRGHLLKLFQSNSAKETLIRMKPITIIAVSGFSSEVGKTTLMCDLLRAFPGWEAIKVTRGHYRSCGRDPHTCCVSDLLSDEPVIRSGREQNYALGKDTGRYWDAGAANVHWVIVTDEQVERGIKQAVASVTAPGVFIEGNSILDFIEADFVVMVSRASGGKIKGSARQALARSSAIYLSNITEETTDERCKFALWRKQSGMDKLIGELPIYTREDLPKLIAVVQKIDLNAHLLTRADIATPENTLLPS